MFKIVFTRFEGRNNLFALVEFKCYYLDEKWNGFIQYMSSNLCGDSPLCKRKGDDLLEKEIILNDRSFRVTSYKEEKINRLNKLTVEFNVTSEEYHDVTTLLYRGTFDVKVLEHDLQFRGSIQQYSTSFTNLYEKGQVGVFTLSLLELQD